MKKLSVIFMLVLFATSLFARIDVANQETIEDNLLVGLKSQNLGLKTSAAYLLGELGTDKSVNSLLSVLKSGNTEEARISAALALTKINTEKAMFAVKQRATFDDSERVRRLCGMFYNQTLQNN